ncbi:MAG TPA: chemotaxis protein CheW [Steroidobacteraceae bacterium]|nr:chemotaxis protein CheW [Steroidobacteraceae bacterium]
MNAAVRTLAAPRWVSFALDAQRYALPLENVSRIVRAAEITPLPLAPDVVAGALDIGGTVMPVYDPRHRLGLPQRPMRLDDQIIIASTLRRPLALVVDRALGIIDAPLIESTTALAPGLRHLRGVLSTPDGLVLIQDLESFLSPDEDAAVDLALSAEVRCSPTP